LFTAAQLKTLLAQVPDDAEVRDFDYELPMDETDFVYLPNPNRLLIFHRRYDGDLDHSDTSPRLAE
jgi:hypothetical protein